MGSPLNAGFISAVIDGTQVGACNSDGKGSRCYIENTYVESGGTWDAFPVPLASGVIGNKRDSAYCGKGRTGRHCSGILQLQYQVAGHFVLHLLFQ